MKNLTWILVADTVHAKIYSVHKPKLFDGHLDDLKMVEEYFHEAGRKKDIDLVTDRQGKFGSGTFVEPTDPKVHENDKFALSLTHILEKNRKQNIFQDLILIAPPAFMGLLHHHLPQDTEKLVSLTIEKDYTHYQDRELAKQLQIYL